MIESLLRIVSEHPLRISIAFNILLASGVIILSFLYRQLYKNKVDVAYIKSTLFFIFSQEFAENKDEKIRELREKIMKQKREQEKGFTTGLFLGIAVFFIISAYSQVRNNFIKQDNELTNK